MDTAQPRCGVCSPSSHIHIVAVSPTEPAETGDLRALVPVVLVAGTTAWALVSPASAHMPALQLDRQKHPWPFSVSSVSPCPSPSALPCHCTDKTQLKMNGHYPKPFLQNSFKFTHGGQSDGSLGCLEKVWDVGRAGGGGCEVQRRCWM